METRIDFRSMPDNVNDFFAQVLREGTQHWRIARQLAWRLLIRNGCQTDKLAMDQLLDEIIADAMLVYVRDIERVFPEKTWKGKHFPRRVGRVPMRCISYAVQMQYTRWRNEQSRKARLVGYSAKEVRNAKLVGRKLEQRVANRSIGDMLDFASMSAWRAEQASQKLLNAGKIGETLQSFCDGDTIPLIAEKQGKSIAWVYARIAEERATFKATAGLK